jgi:sec-independent protein translocase protein TatA
LREGAGDSARRAGGAEVLGAAPLETRGCDNLPARYTPHMPFGMGFGELVLILVIVTVIFGATKLPQLGDGLGRSIKNFKRALGSLNEIDVTPRTSPSPEAKVDPPAAAAAATPKTPATEQAAK